jgi:hypothetical protein
VVGEPSRVVPSVEKVVETPGVTADGPGGRLAGSGTGVPMI